MDAITTDRDRPGGECRGDDERGLHCIIANHAAERHDQLALIFLGGGEGESVSLTYAELYRQAKAIAGNLAANGFRGKRMLLLLPSCTEYVTAFIGCLMAGVVAVPLYPPRHNWHDKRLAAIANDAEAAGVITLSEFTSGILDGLKQAGAQGLDIVVAVDALPEAPVPPACNKDATEQIAYLQYTSGSTGDPRGVIVGHGDLARTARLANGAVGLRAGEVAVSWLPLFHDLGWVLGIVMPLVAGGTAVFMPPAAFLQKPMCWLWAISSYGAVFSGAPNFAYQECVQRIEPEELRGLSLGDWRVALNAAEPISAATMEAFARKFAGTGLRRNALVGGYGLAEATLYVTGNPGIGAPILYLDKAALSNDRVELHPCASEHTVAIVSSGLVTSDPEICVVNPQTRKPTRPGTVGEIWVAGSAICKGYWRNAEATAETFGQALAGTEQHRFMRTGDLGIVHDRHLFITGRIKDLIIIRGANHYPQDIEHDAEEAHPAFRQGGFCAAFAWDELGANRLVVVQEVKRTERHKVDVHAAGESVAKVIAARHGIEVDLLILVEPAVIPRTSSGKIQRKACRELMQSGALKEIGRWRRLQFNALPRVASVRRSPAEIETLLSDLVTGLTGIKAIHHEREARFIDLGLDSAKLVQLVKEIASLLDVAISPAVAFEYPSIASLALYLAGLEQSNAGAAARPAEPMAIVGMACRFPGAQNVMEFWSLLTSGRYVVGAVSTTRQALTGLHAGTGMPYRFIGELPDIDRFDAALFGIAAREAGSMDPQQRLMLEVAWHAFEHAGMAPDSLAGTSTGVFVGISANDYFRLQKTEGQGYDEYSGTGGALSIAANRLSYCFGLQGPSLAIDTACSSSLVAVHQACLSLAAGECDAALAGGVSMALSEELGAIFTQARMLSPGGRCKTFDQEADGYVRGEGCGAVILKRLRDAERDGDRILAVIRGSAVNQDGRSNGLTAPNGSAQRQVIRAALKRAGCTPGSIGFVETHGTGTPLGDPIEVEALKAELDAGVDNPCLLGAVKTQIGHLEAAAGIAGLIKTVLVLLNRHIPANHGFKSLNRHIDLENSRLQVATAAHSWNCSPGSPRRAGVSAFGFGGTNAHVILEEHAMPQSAGDTSRLRTARAAPLLLTLSANSESSLELLAGQYAIRFRAASAAAAVQLCTAANRERAHLPERLAIVANDKETLVAQLRQFSARGKVDSQAGWSGRSSPGARRVAFLFTGQGAQCAGMGMDLYRAEPLFRQHIDYCDAIVRPLLDVPISVILWGEEDRYLQDPRFVQPAQVALEVGMARLWQSYGVTPDCVLGYSAGEYAAACIAGIFTLDQALQLAFHSHPVEQVTQLFREQLERASFREAAIPFVPSVHCAAPPDSPAYWVDQLHEPVQFNSAMQTAVAAGVDTFIDMGPAPVLLDLGQRIVESTNWIATMRPGTDAAHQWLCALGEAFSAGVRVSLPWETDEPRPDLDLPLYPFDRQAYWFVRRADRPQSVEELPSPAADSANSFFPAAADLVALGAHEALRVIGDVLIELTAQVLRQPILNDRTDHAAATNMRLADLGLDSLMAMEIRNRVRNWLSLDLPAYVLINGSTFGDVADLLYEQLLLAAVRRDASEKDGDMSGSEVIVL